MFRPFTLEDIYMYAEKMGYTKDDVEIEEYDGQADVGFGWEGEYWDWHFDDLTKTATNYLHDKWED